MLVVTGDVGANGQDEFFQIAKHASPQPVLRDVPEG
jgi:hypothetical protein